MQPVDTNFIVRKMLPLLPEVFREGKNPYVFVLVCGLIFNMLIYAVFNPYENGSLYPLLYSGSLLGLILLATFRYIHIHTGIHLATFLGVLHALYGIYQTGGIYSPQMAWSLVLPLTPFFVISRFSGYLWLSFTLGLQAVIAWQTNQDWFFRKVEMTPENVSTSALTCVTLTIYLIIVPVLYVLMTRDAMRERQRQNEELIKQRLALEQIFKLREQFISTISHELRTPMNAIMGFTVLLVDHYQEQAAVHKILKHSQQSAEHLMTVINDILDYSQMHSGHLSAQAEVFELRELVRYAFELFSLRLQDSLVQYECQITEEVPIWVETDRHRLMQVLVNLLGNAIKFTQKGHVHLKVSKSSFGVMFSVHDTGIGIAQEHKANIFKRFSQANESIQQRFGGNGLGLSISQKLVEWLGGRMGFDSTLHVGSTFWFELPLQERGVQDEVLLPAHQAIQSKTGQWCFLIVDDHKVNRLLAKQVLIKAWPACTILEVEDGAQALEVLKFEAVDAVLMDMVMPVMDGTEATREIRRQGLGGPDLLIIGLTANVNVKDLEDFREAGLDELVLKPFQANALTTMVDGLLHKRPR
jgi:signal transduction histidine kinase/CheY-like chemotaxis protein